MNPVHFLLFGDLAGRLSRDTSASDRVTSAAVAVEAGVAAELRARIAGRFKKWGESSPTDAADMVEILCGAVAGVGICSFVKAEPQWTAFWNAAKPLHEAIVREERRAASFIKPANAALFVLFNYAFTVAMARAVVNSKTRTMRDDRGLKVYDRTVICDSDLQGHENTDVFTYLWNQSDVNQARINELGMCLRTREVKIATEQSEPLLLLADFAAGLGQSAHVANPGRIPFPVSHAESKTLLARFVACSKGVVVDEMFSFKYEEMFGTAYASATLDHKR